MDGGIMLGTPCTYVQQHYSVPACIVRRVVASGKPGTIVEDRGHYIGVLLDGERHVGNHHPTWEMQYGEMVDKLPKLRRFSNYDRYHDEEWNCDFHEFLGINRPHREKRKHEGQWQYRMYRTRDGRPARYDWSSDREVQGAWCLTAPKAKASYKAALAARKQRNAA